MDLTLGVARPETFSGSDYARLLRLEITQAGPLLVRIDPGTGETAVAPEIYLKQGTPPTRSDYDLRSAASPSAQPQTLLPRAAVGTWYVLVYAPHVPAPRPYIIRADTAPVLLDLGPARGP